MGTDYDTMQPARRLPVGRCYAAVRHTCCVCGHTWHSATAKDARDVVKAIKANHDGPYCILCLHLEMAARYAEARGYNGVRKAMVAWKRRNGRARLHRAAAPGAEQAAAQPGGAVDGYGVGVDQRF